jgi:RNA polymerase sigma-70 factor, ECF subfamily
MAEACSETLLLLGRWHQGERRALDQLLARDLPWVRRYVERRMGELLRAKGDVEDYVQEAMIQAMEYGPRFLVSDKEQFRALLARITENVLRDQVVYHRAQKRDVDKERPLLEDSALALDPPVGEVTRPSVVMDRKTEKTWIRLAMELLDEDEREMLRLREWEEHSFAEIAEILELSEDAARMRFNRILPKLAKNVVRLRDGGLSQILEETMRGSVDHG